MTDATRDDAATLDWRQFWQHVENALIFAYRVRNPKKRMRRFEYELKLLLKPYPEYRNNPQAVMERIDRIWEEHPEVRRKVCVQ